MCSSSIGKWFENLTRKSDYATLTETVGSLAPNVHLLDMYGNIFYLPCFKHLNIRSYDVLNFHFCQFNSFSQELKNYKEWFLFKIFNVSRCGFRCFGCVLSCENPWYVIFFDEFLFEHYFRLMNFFLHIL